MKPTIELFIGAPLAGSEASFLSKLYSDLSPEGQCLILANFEVVRNSTSAQIDFIVVTRKRAELLELKCLTGPVFGTENGPWKIEDSSGNHVTYPGKNPWQQAKDDKLIINDAMHQYQKRFAGVPRPLNGRFFEFDASVCIYPKLHPRSEVTRGNFKAWVRSYDNALSVLKTRLLTSSWSFDEWRGFATQHLRLTPVTLKEAIDPAFNLARHHVREYLARLEEALANGLGPLLAGEQSERCGENVLEELLGESNYVLLGSSGLGKSFHLQHLALRAPKQVEVPILVEARHVIGDFTAALRRAIGPFTGIEPNVFLDSIRKCALRPLLVVDGVTGREAFVPNLLKDIVAFQVQYEARVVLGSQKEIHLPGGFTAHPVALAPLKPEHKRAIYSFHAGITDTPDLEPFYEAFATAFDLMIAGRIHGDTRKSLTRAELYERYCREMLPARYSAVAASVLRDLARRMSTDFVSSISLQEFERGAEALLRRNREPLQVLDDLRSCRLLIVEDEIVSFQHDLLKDYFLAETLWRDSVDSVQLGEKLSKPANQDLIEFILPKFISSSDIRSLLRSTNDAGFLLDILKGKAGPKAREVLRGECNDLLDYAIRDLGEIELTFQKLEALDGKSRVGRPLLSTPRQWSAYEARLCDLWAQSLDDEHFCQRFMTLLDLTEQALKAASDKAARELGISARACWGELIREFAGGLTGGEFQLPLERVMWSIRSNYGFFRRGRKLTPSLYDGLVGRATRTPPSDFAMALILELMRWHQLTNVDLRIKLLEIAAKNRIYILWVQAVEMIQSCTNYVMDKRPEARDRIVEILEKMLGSLSIDTIGIMEALSGFGAMDPPVALETALDEFRTVARGDLSEHDLSLISIELKQSPDQFLADKAYGLLGRIFEDIFQGVYWEAFDSLDESEKVGVLCRAGMAADPGFHITWILEQLIASGDTAAAPVYQRFASLLDKESPFRQEAVGALVLGIAGSATMNSEPCRMEGPDTPDLRAWGLVAQMLFWMFRLGPESSKTPVRSLWECLNTEAPLAAADVFFELSRLGGSSELRNDVHGKLLRLMPDETRKMLDESLTHRDRLTSLFRPWQGRDIELLRFVIDGQGEFGREASLPSLRSLAEDVKIGPAAIAAIKRIRNRERGLETTK